jgi:phosphonate transport system ATP-binding protein
MDNFPRDDMAALPAAGVGASHPAPEGELAVTGLTKAFQPAPPVFAGVSFQVGRGEAVALIGGNGAGKSTLLRCCVRLIEPTSGEISLFGNPIAGYRRQQLRRLRRQVGFVFQHHNLVPRLSALSNVLHGALGHGAGPRCWLHAVAPAARREQAMRCLDRVGLAEFAARRADRLSGGQSQRVAIARALMQQPRLILADEPVASLDPAAGEEVMALLVGLLRDQGVTLVFASHHLQHALRYADRIIGLRAGHVALDAPATQLSLEQLRDLYD